MNTLATRGVHPRRRSKLTRLGDANPLVPYLFLLPFTLFYLVFTVYPLAYGVWLSLHRWDPLVPDQPFVGLENYRRLFDPLSNQFDYFWRALLNTAFFTAVSVPLLVGVALLLAVQLYGSVPGRAFFRSVFFLPGILSVSVMAVLWKWMFENRVGLVNVVGREVFGLPLVSWLTTEWLAWVPIVVGTVWWTVGFNMTLYLAALSGIPKTLYEAAEVDGAGSWIRFWRITLPLLAPTTLFVVVTTILGAFQLFGQSVLITGGGPTQSTMSVIQYVTQEAFGNYQFSSAAAMSIVFGLLLLLFTGLQFRLITYDGGRKR